MPAYRKDSVIVLPPICNRSRRFKNFSIPSTPSARKEDLHGLPQTTLQGSESRRLYGETRGGILRETIVAVMMHDGRRDSCRGLVVSCMTARNLVQLTYAIGLFVPLLVVPGFVFGWVSNLTGFRGRTPGTRLMLANVFSVSLCPVCTYLIGRFGSFGLIWLFYGALWLAFLGLFITSKAVRESLLCLFMRSRRAYLAIVGVWVVVGTVSLSDIRTPTGLYRSLNTYDYVKHTSVVDAITRTGVPPVNPSFHPGRDLPLCYYYFWHLMGSLVDRMGGDYLSARSATQAGTLWAGLSLFSIIILFLRLMPPAEKPTDRRSEFIALALLLVTGLDLLPAITLNILFTIFPDQFRPLPMMEWWNDQVTAWSNMMIWVPQHLASLVACLTAFLVLRVSLESKSRRGVPIVFAALALSSGLGMSVWVTLVACLTLACWTAYCAVQRWTNEVLTHAAVALVLLAVSLPFIIDLRTSNESPGFPLVLGLRQFWVLEMIATRCHLSSVWATQVLRAVSLPLNYYLELGFFLVASIVYWRRRMRDALPLTVSERFLLSMALVSIVACTCLRSSVLYNDFGWRGFMFAQFMMLLWSIPLARSIVRSRTRRALSPILGTLSRSNGWRLVLLFSFYIGVSGTFYDMILQRALCIGATGRTGLELAQTYEWVRDHTSPEQIIQHNPRQHVEFFHGLYGNRQMVVADETHGPLFGVDRSLARTVTAEVGAIFETPSTQADALAVCRQYEIDVLIFTSADPLWQDRQSWIWTQPPAFQNAAAHVFLMGRNRREGP
jgi:hypothetical protein